MFIAQILPDPRHHAADQIGPTRLHTACNSPDPPLRSWDNRHVPARLCNGSGHMDSEST